MDAIQDTSGTVPNVIGFHTPGMVLDLYDNDILKLAQAAGTPIPGKASLPYRDAPEPPEITNKEDTGE